MRPDFPVPPWDHGTRPAAVARFDDSAAGRRPRRLLLHGAGSPESRTRPRVPGGADSATDTHGAYSDVEPSVQLTADCNGRDERGRHSPLRHMPVSRSNSYLWPRTRIAPSAMTEP